MKEGAGREAVALREGVICNMAGTTAEQAEDTRPTFLRLDPVTFDVFMVHLPILSP